MTETVFSNEASPIPRTALSPRCFLWKTTRRTSWNKYIIFTNFCADAQQRKQQEKELKFSHSRTWWRNYLLRLLYQRRSRLLSVIPSALHVSVLFPKHTHVHVHNHTRVRQQTAAGKSAAYIILSHSHTHIHPWGKFSGTWKQLRWALGFISVSLFFRCTCVVACKMACGNSFSSILFSTLHHPSLSLCCPPFPVCRPPPSHLRSPLFLHLLHPSSSQLCPPRHHPHPLSLSPSILLSAGRRWVMPLAGRLKLSLPLSLNISSLHFSIAVFLSPFPSFSHISLPCTTICFSASFCFVLLLHYKAHASFISQYLSRVSVSLSQSESQIAVFVLICPSLQSDVQKGVHKKSLSRSLFFNVTNTNTFFLLFTVLHLTCP